MDLFLKGGLLFHPALAGYPLASTVFIALGLLLALFPPFAPFRGRLHRLLFRSGDIPFRIFLFGTGTAIFAMTSVLLFDGLPRLTDGIAAVFQAKILLRGDIRIPLHPDDGFFFLPGILSSKAGVSHWSSMYPPGWPALLVPGAAVGVTWIVNPLLGGLLAVGVTLLGGDLYGNRTGRIAGTFTILSPFVTIISASHLSHTATALFCCLSLWAALRMLRSGGMEWGMISGLSWGIAFLCRPLTALVLGVVFAFWIASTPRQLLRRWRPAALALLLCFAAVALLAAYQATITGDPLTPGHKLGMGRFGTMGFGEIDSRNVHTPAMGAEHTLQRFRNLNMRLLGWPVSALLLFLLPFLFDRERKEHWWLLAGPCTLLLVFATFWYYERYFPARYTFAAIPMVIVLAARGWTFLAALLSKAGSAVPSAVAAASILFTMGVSNVDYFGAHGKDFGGMENILPKVVDAYRIDNAVVFMDTPGECEVETMDSDDYYGAGFLRNSLDLDSSVIYARNSRSLNLRLMERYPERSFFLYRYLRCEGQSLLYRLVPGKGPYSIIPLPALLPEVRMEPFSG